MIEVQASMGVFEGKPGDLLFTYDQQALTQNKYTAGKLTAWVICHNDPRLCCLNVELYQMMCGQRPDLNNFQLDRFLDDEVAKNLIIKGNF